MYKDMKDSYWWNGTNKDIAQYIAKCDTCKKVNIKHQALDRVMQVGRYRNGFYCLDYQGLNKGWTRSGDH